MDGGRGYRGGLRGAERQEEGPRAPGGAGAGGGESLPYLILGRLGCFPEGTLSLWESGGGGAGESVFYQACDIRQAGLWSRGLPVTRHKHPGRLPSVTGNWQPCPPLDASQSHPRSSSHTSFPSLAPGGTRGIPSGSQGAQNVCSQ